MHASNMISLNIFVCYICIRIFISLAGNVLLDEPIKFPIILEIFLSYGRFCLLYYFLFD